LKEAMPSLSNQLMLEELLAVMREKDYIFFSRYEALTVSAFSALRRKLEKVSDRSVVVKNRIAKIAFEQVGIKDVNGLIKGSTLVTVAGKDPQMVSKVLIEFGKDQKSFVVAGACLEGKLYEVPYVQELAALPSREVLVATVINGLNAPIGGFVNVMSQMLRSFAVVLDQIGKQKAG
jgi:large subunit ribosomal protein L10